MTKTDFADSTDRADMSNPSEKALKKLSWIAELYEQRTSDRFPRDPAGLRSLLGRASADVWTACRLLETPEPDRSDNSDTSDRRGGLIPTHGGYRRLLGFQVAEVVYDGTAIFCERFIDKYSRTNDQMVQAARSGRQNIAEGSAASATSKKTELKLTNVAKASLEELLLDFEDFLRRGGLSQWDKDSPEAQAVRKRYRSKNKSDGSDQSDMSDKRDPYGIGSASPEAAANTLICLTNQAIYLLKKQIGYLEKDFVENGGFTERLYRTRTEHRANSKTYYHRDGDPRKGVEK
ncbi:four helix bundle suffix domain-containing protein [Planctomycetota bacterium]